MQSVWHCLTDTAKKTQKTTFRRDVAEYTKLGFLGKIKQTNQLGDGEYIISISRNVIGKSHIIYNNNNNDLALFNVYL